MNTADHDEQSPSRALKKIETELKNHATVNNILRSARKEISDHADLSCSTSEYEGLYRGILPRSIQFW